MTRSAHHFKPMKDRSFIVALMFPALLLMLALRVVPILFSVYLSMTGWNLNFANSMNTFVGLENYKLFFTSPEYIDSVVITLKIGIWSTLLSMLVGTALAFLMYQELRGSAVVRTFIISAMIMAPIVVGTAWRLMYNPGTVCGA